MNTRSITPYIPTLNNLIRKYFKMSAMPVTEVLKLLKIRFADIWINSIAYLILYTYCIFHLEQV